MTALPRLNVAALLPDTRALGPGRRFAIWVQGCCFDCPGCVAPEWIPQRVNQWWPVADLVERIVREPALEGLTLSGGEPFLQAGALAALVRAARALRPGLTVIAYSGWRLEALRGQDDADRRALLGQLDVLIDGLYRQDLNDGRGLRGSANQRVHFLSGVYADQRETFERAPRRVEFHWGEDDSVLLAGLPPRRLTPALAGLLQPTA